MDWNAEIGKLRGPEREFLKNVVETLTVFQINHEQPAQLRLLGKYTDGCRIDLDNSWPIPKPKK